MTKPAPRAWRLLGAAGLLLTACAAPGGAPSLPPSLPLVEALRTLGTVDVVDGAASPEVVLLKDRHAVGQGIFQVDEELRAFQRDQRAVVGGLVARGFTLLGCEHTLGPIPRHAAAQDHLEAIEQVRVAGDDLNGWSVFQPLRYEVELGPRLEVFGVEDPALYRQDLDTLVKIEDVIATRRAAGSSGNLGRRLDAEERRLLGQIRANVDERGRLAARNLLDLARARGAERAILLLGASHVPAASKALQEASVRHYVFEARTFRRGSRP
jgi:hypothetical protein